MPCKLTYKYLVIFIAFIPLFEPHFNYHSMNKLPRLFVAISLAICLVPGTTVPGTDRFDALRPQSDLAGVEEKLSPVHPELVEGRSSRTGLEEFPIQAWDDQEGIQTEQRMVEQFQVAAQQQGKTLTLTPVYAGRWFHLPWASAGNRPLPIQIVPVSDWEGGSELKPMARYGLLKRVGLYDGKETVFFVRFGPRFFVDRRYVSWLSPEFREELGSNLFVVENIERHTLSSAVDNSSGHFGFYSYTTAAFLVRTDLSRKLVIDLGAGDGSLSFMHNGLPVLLEMDSGELSNAGRQFSANLKQKDKDFFLIGADLTKKADLDRAAERLKNIVQRFTATHPVDGVVIVSNIGQWESYSVDNRTIIGFVPWIEQATSLPVQLIVAGGYLRNDPRTEYPDYSSKHAEEAVRLGFHVDLESQGQMFPYAPELAVAWRAVRSAVRPSADSYSTGLEEPPVPEELEAPELPEASAYQVIPLVDVMEFLVSLTRDERQAFLNRLLIEKDPVQKGHGRHYLVKWRTPSDKTSWHDKDDPAREYLFSHLVRELGGDVTDVVIPDLDERRRLAEFYGVADPNDLYLVELSEDYSVEDREAVPEPDPDAAFTRDFGIAVLLRMYDFREKNFGPIRGSSTRMMFDGDQAFSPDAEEIGPFALAFAINYWDQPAPGPDDLFELDPNRLLGRLHLDELQRLVKTVHDFQEKRLQEIVEQAPPHLQSRMRKLIRPLHAWLQSYRSDLTEFLELFTADPQSEFWHPHPVSWVLPEGTPLAITTDQVRQALALAGLEETGQERVARLLEAAAGRSVDRPFQICFLCNQNRERSPVLQLLLKDFSAKRGMDWIQVESGAVLPWFTGELVGEDDNFIADELILSAQQEGIPHTLITELAQQGPRVASGKLLKESDLIFVTSRFLPHVLEARLREEWIAGDPEKIQARLQLLRDALTDKSLRENLPTADWGAVDEANESQVRQIMDRVVTFYDFLGVAHPAISSTGSLNVRSQSGGSAEFIGEMKEALQPLFRNLTLIQDVPPKVTYGVWLMWWNPEPVAGSIFPTIYPPEDSDDNSGTYHMVLALKHLQAQGNLTLKGIRAVDMGVGSGPLTGYLLSEEVEQVVGIDQNPSALPNTHYNLRTYLPALEGRFTGYLGDLWDAIPPEVQDLFDLAVFNAPAIHGNPIHPGDANEMAGANFSTLKQFIRGLPGRLSPSGKALLRIVNSSESENFSGFRLFGPKALQEFIASEHLLLNVEFIEERGSFVVAVLTRRLPDSAPGLAGTKTDLAGLEEGPRHWVAVIGAGPAGIAAAERLRALGHEVALFNEAAPYGGLAVYGVYPNKEDPMKMAYRFRSLGPAVVTPGIHYYGNVRVGKGGDLTLDQLRELGFSAVVVAVGAEGSKPLGIPGERPNLPGLYQAKDLVAFYQGDPAQKNLDPQLGKTTVWIGMGNVTVDTTHYAIHRRDYAAVEKFVRSLRSEEWKRVLRALKKYLPGESQLRRNLSFYRPGVGRTVDVDELREALRKAKLEEFLIPLDWAWEQTAGVEFTRNAYWVARRGPDQKAFDPKELEVLAPYIDLEDLREELDRVAVVLGWSILDEAAAEQRLHRLLFGHPETGKIAGDVAEKLKRFGTRLDKARIRMRFLLRGHSIEGEHAGGLVLSENEMKGDRLIETDRIAPLGEVFRGTPIDSVVLSIGNEHDADFGLETQRGLFATREKVPAGENPSVPAHFQSAAAEDVFLAGWALQPSTGKVGKAKNNGTRAVDLAVGPYLAERSDLKKPPEALQADRAALDRVLGEIGVQKVSGGQAAALHAWFIQNGYQPNDRSEILRIAQDLEDRKVTSELLREARLPEGVRIFAQKNAIPREVQRLFEKQGIEVVDLPNDLEEARSLLGVAGDLSNAVAWLSSSVEWFERDEWNGLFTGLGLRALQLVGVMPHSVDRWSLAHWAALFGAFPKAGLQVILSVEEVDRGLSIYV